MCGLAGLVSNEINEEERHVIVSRMMQYIENRGPDEKGIYSYKESTFGFARLSIREIDNGTQPFLHRNKSTFSMTNGEIYNFDYLRNRYSSEEWVTKSDCESIHGAYDNGDFENEIKLFSGMFASSIYDASENSLTILRDRVGQKPLFYSLINKNTFIFSSSLKAIISSGLIDVSFDEENLKFILSNEYAPIGYSGIKKIFAVKPSEIISWKIGTRNLVKNEYWKWTLGTIELETKPTYAPMKRQIHEDLIESVKEELISDVPISIFLSGGIDSSIIASLAAEQSKYQVETFTIGFEDKSLDETKFSTEIAKKIGTNHKLINFDSEDFKDLNSRAFKNLDIPLGDSSYIPTFLLCEKVSNYYKCALSGDGGDELLGGYPTYRAHKFLSLYESLIPQKMRGYLMHNFLKLVPHSDKNISMEMKLSRFLAGKTMPLVKRHFTWMSTTIDKSVINGIMSNSVISKIDSYNALEDLLSSVGIKDPINAAQFIDLNSYLPGSILSKLDNASMSNGLEVRSPFVNKRMLNGTGMIPSSYKVDLLRSKKILRDIAKDIYGRRISKLPKKGLNFSVSKILSKELEKNIRSSLFWLEDYINIKYTNQIIDEHLSGIKNHRKLLWTIYSVANWWSEVKKIDKKIDNRKLYKYEKLV